jgi:hypothetical protein
MASPNYIKFDDLRLPLLEDSASIQIAITKITDAFVSSRIDARRAGLLLYAVQLASQNIDRVSDRANAEIMHFMTVTNTGDEMAPEKEICEPSDCASCNRRDTCDDYDPEEEDQELTKEEVAKI